jgi:hypothetical protein
MGKIKEDRLREDRIMNEIVADAHDAEEGMMGWQAYLDDSLRFPFRAKCIQEIEASPLKKDEKVTVLKLADMDLYRNNVSVIIEWQNRRFGVPLEQILPIDADEETLEAVKDWHYWTGRGYQF